MADVLIWIVLPCLAYGYPLQVAERFYRVPGSPSEVVARVDEMKYITTCTDIDTAKHAGLGFLCKLTAREEENVTHKRIHKKTIKTKRNHGAGNGLANRELFNDGAYSVAHSKMYDPKDADPQRKVLDREFTDLELSPLQEPNSVSLLSPPSSASLPYYGTCAQVAGSWDYGRLRLIERRMRERRCLVAEVESAHEKVAKLMMRHVVSPGQRRFHKMQKLQCYLWQSYIECMTNQSTTTTSTTATTTTTTTTEPTTTADPTSAKPTPPLDMPPDMGFLPLDGLLLFY